MLFQRERRFDDAARFHSSSQNVLRRWNVIRLAQPIQTVKIAESKRWSRDETRQRFTKQQNRSADIHAIDESIVERLRLYIAFRSLERREAEVSIDSLRFANDREEFSNRSETKRL